MRDRIPSFCRKSKEDAPCHMIKPYELILGKTIPFVLIGLADVTLIICAGKLIFDLPIRGSLLLLFGVALIFILTTLSLGLFLSTISRTQQQALMSAFFFMVPAMLLSGIFCPRSSDRGRRG